MRFAAILFSCACASLAQQPNELTAKEKKEGWRLLFDGKSFQGWHQAGGSKEFPGWNIENGTIHSLSRPALREDLFTDEEFGDFELAFEWRVAPRANSGVKYRIQDSFLVDEAQINPRPRRFELQVEYEAVHRQAKREKVRPGSGAQEYPIGFEYQVIDDAGHPDSMKNPTSRAGALYRMAAPSKPMAKPVGEWNQGRIVVRGTRTEHWLNGEKVVDTDLRSPEVRKHIEERWKDSPTVLKLLTEVAKRRTPIALQHHNDEAWYRNIKIRPMDATAGR
jgi:hypothetical protein